MSRATQTAEKIEAKVEAEIPFEAQVPAVAAGGAISARAQKMMRDAGKGVSTSAEDKLIPLVGILQAQSPQCLKQKAEYIKGAEAGKFFCRNAAEPVLDVLEFQPVTYSRAWVEWRSRDAGGGLVAQHADLPADAIEVQDPVTGRAAYRRPNGNDLIDTRYQYGLMGRPAYVIPLTSTGHTFFKTWQTLMDQFVLPNNKPEPAFANIYKLTTVPRSNSAGDWYGWKVEHLRPATDEEYDRGLALYDAIKAGEKVADAASMTQADVADDTGGGAI